MTTVLLRYFCLIERSVSVWAAAHRDERRTATEIIDRGRIPVSSSRLNEVGQRVYHRRSRLRVMTLDPVVLPRCSCGRVEALPFPHRPVRGLQQLWRLV